MSLAGKTLFITGGSRGIGLAIALKAAAEGANIAIAAKTVEPPVSELHETFRQGVRAGAPSGGAALVSASRRFDMPQDLIRSNYECF